MNVILIDWEAVNTVSCTCTHTSHAALATSAALNLIPKRTRVVHDYMHSPCVDNTPGIHNTEGQVHFEVVKNLRYSI